jgi:chromosome segregation ATPase
VSEDIAAIGNKLLGALDELTQTMVALEVTITTLQADLAAAKEREGRLREALEQADAAMEALHPDAAGDMSDWDYSRLWNATRDALGAALKDPAP